MNAKRMRGGLAACVCLAALCAAAGVDSREWISMGTVARVSAKDGGAADCAPARETFARLEKILSAHDRRSELSQLAPLADDAVLARCSPEVRACYAAAFRFRDETGGLFNPRWRGAGTLDLGAIAKGFAVDEAARRYPADGKPLLIDLGGNLKAVRGVWKTGVQDPRNASAWTETFALSNGMACATSGTYARGEHIRDGRTGAAARTGVASVTVIHPTSAMLADALSTTLFLLGKEKGDAFLKAHHPEARAIWIERVGDADTPF